MRWRLSFESAGIKLRILVALSWAEVNSLSASAEQLPHALQQYLSVDLAKLL